jgi:hypothetical protein
MLWQKLQRDMPATLAETIKIADSYALGDPLQPTLDSQGQGQSQRNNNNAGDPRSSIALITGIKEEMTDRITGMARPKWRPWKKSKQAPAVASV